MGQYSLSQAFQLRVLGSWDTSGLSGLYAVELQVIRTDQQIDTAITQITVK